MQHTSSNMSSNVWGVYLCKRRKCNNGCTLHPSLSIKLKEDLNLLINIGYVNITFTSKTHLDNLRGIYTGITNMKTESH